ncbi:alpha/beta hydrolase domain-containing protein [Thalassotalea maritima]|uniref:alpha/beta hydrolase domain-containing protein n=1 Tax=Thalassotalea maritima TaxID=3242416 RepID=UPI003526FEB0
MINAIAIRQHCKAITYFAKTLCVLVVFLPTMVAAKVTSHTVNSNTAMTIKGQAYEVIAGEFEFAIDPNNKVNRVIVDIYQAPTNSDGMVSATATYLVIQPKDPSKRKGALLEVSNRGAKASLRYFNYATSKDDISKAWQLGDGFIQELGLSLVWVGWQADVKANASVLKAELPRVAGVEGTVRSDWTVDKLTTRLELAHRPQLDTIYPVNVTKKDQALLTKRLTRDGLKTVVQAKNWQFSADGKAIEGIFQPAIYELSYPSKDPQLAGLGLAIVRDTAEFLKDEASPYWVPYTIAFGISQTGRFLRHFLHQGFNETETGKLAFDGMFIHSAGAGRGSFNHRFAQPSRDAHRMSAFFYPTDVFPFTSRRVRDPVSKKKQGLLVRHHQDFYPKIFYSNTGYEYWGRAAALIHTHDIYDVEPLPNERIFHLASTQHYIESSDKLVAIAEHAGLYQGNPIDFRVHLRALMAALTNWVVEGQSPPNSRYPTFAQQTLINFGHFEMPNWMNIATPFKPHTAYALNYGKRWADGIIDNQPPKIHSEIIPAVPNTDSNGHELGGIRHPLIEAPIASFIPWSLRYGLFASNELKDFRGSMLKWPRKRILQRYGSERDYLSHINKMIDASVQEGWILARDRARVRQQARWLWEWSMSAN